MRRPRVTFLATLLAATSCAGVATSPPPCDATVACEASRACVLGRCRETGTAPVSTLARRVTWRPAGRVLDVDGERALTGGGSRVLRLARDEDDVTLVLDFRDATVPTSAAPPTATGQDVPLREAPPGTLQRALLVLEAAALPNALAGSVEVAVAEVLEGFDLGAADTLGERTLPRTARPLTAAPTPIAPGAALVVDVTEVVRGWTRPRTHRGLVVTLRPTPGTRGAFTLQDPDRGSPRLDVYLAPTTAELGPKPVGGAAPADDAARAGEASEGTSTGEREPGDEE
ncbi:MAG: hypothetical protein FJ096_16995 [Deltaproteobacteria bacterium]|nr:hypothetical protein [Deltaproteobacteria bacterium]